MKSYRTLGHSLFGGSGAAGTLYLGQHCSGGCGGCFGCVAFTGALVGWALIQHLKTRGKRHGMAARND